MINGEHTRPAPPPEPEEPTTRAMTNQDLAEYQQALQVFCQFIGTFNVDLINAYLTISKKRLELGPTEEDLRLATVQQVMKAKITVKFLRDMSQLILQAQERLVRYKKDQGVIQ